MVPPPPGADDPPRPSWLTRLDRTLRLTRRSVVVVLSAPGIGGIRALRERGAVFTDDLASAEPGALVVTVLEARDVERMRVLNRGREVVANHRLRLVLWCLEGAADTLAREAPDLYDWASWIGDVPWTPPGFLLRALRRADRGDRPLAWLGPGSAETLRHASLEAVEVDTGDLDALYEAMGSAAWIRVPGAVDTVDARRVRWMMERAGRRGRVLVEGVRVGGWSTVDARPAAVTASARKLGSLDRALLTDLEADAVALAELLPDVDLTGAAEPDRVLAEAVLSRGLTLRGPPFGPQLGPIERLTEGGDDDGRGSRGPGAAALGDLVFARWAAARSPETSTGASLGPTWEHDLHLAARASGDVGDLGRAIRATERRVHTDAHPWVVESQVRLGLARRWQGQHASATEAFRRAFENGLRIDPENPAVVEAWSALGAPPPLETSWGRAKALRQVEEHLGARHPGTAAHLLAGLVEAGVTEASERLAGLAVPSTDAPPLDRLRCLWKRILHTPRSRGVIEAPEERTHAVIQDVLAIAAAHLGHPWETRLPTIEQLADSTEDPLFGAIASLARQRREEATHGSSPIPFPEDGLELGRLQTYKLNRLRGASVLLEPLDARGLDPFREFNREARGPRHLDLVGHSGATASSWVRGDDPERAVLALRAGDLDPTLVDEGFARWSEVEAPPLRVELVLAAEARGAVEWAARMARTLGDDVGGVLLEPAVHALVSLGLEASAEVLLDAARKADRGVPGAVDLAGCELALGLSPSSTALDAVLDLALDRPPTGWRIVPLIRISALYAVRSGLAGPDRLLDRLLDQLPWTTDSFNTNSHFCLTVVRLADTIASAIVEWHTGRRTAPLSLQLPRA